MLHVGTLDVYDSSKPYNIWILYPVGYSPKIHTGNVSINSKIGNGSTILFSKILFTVKTFFDF